MRNGNQRHSSENTPDLTDVESVKCLLKTPLIDLREAKSSVGKEKIRLKDSLTLSK
jgi:hypothetical protein